MKICIVSDSHDRGQMLAAAVGEAKARREPSSVRQWRRQHCATLACCRHVVHGNNLGDPVAIAQLACDSTDGWPITDRVRR